MRAAAVHARARWRPSSRPRHIAVSCRRLDDDIDPRILSTAASLHLRDVTATHLALAPLCRRRRRRRLVTRSCFSWVVNYFSLIVRHHPSTLS